MTDTTATTTAEFLPPHDINEAIALKPITWGQLAFLIDYVARAKPDASMKLLARMCDDIIYELPLSPAAA